METLFYTFGIFVLFWRVRGFISNAMDSEHEEDSKAIGKSLDLLLEGTNESNVDSINNSMSLIIKTPTWEWFVKVLIAVWAISGIIWSNQVGAFWCLFSWTTIAICIKVLVCRNPLYLKNWNVLTRFVQALIVFHILVNYFIK